MVVAGAGVGTGTAVAGNPKVKVTTTSNNTTTAPHSNNPSGIDFKKVGYLIRDEDRPDIEAFLERCPLLCKEYIPVAIIGEGKLRHYYQV